MEGNFEWNFEGNFDGNFERKFESEMGTDFKLKIFKNNLSGERHYALVKNLLQNNQPTYVRMHKLDITKDIFEEKNIFGDEISKSFKIIEEKGSGAIVLINSDMAPNIQKIFKQMRNGGKDMRKNSGKNMKIQLMSKQKNQKKIEVLQKSAKKSI